MNVKLETLCVKSVLGTQIYELNALESRKIDCIVMSCIGLGDLFFRLDESSREFPIFAPFESLGWNQ